MSAEPEPLIQDLGKGEAEALLKYKVSSEDLEVYGRKYRKQLKGGFVELDVKFRYACCLVHSNQLDVKQAVTLLEELFKEGDTQIKRDSLFYLAVAHTKLKEYVVAKKLVTSFLSVEPGNTQAKQLLSYIESHLKSDGLMGMAIVGGAAVFGGLAAVAIGGLVLFSGAGMAISRLVRSKRN